MELLQPFLLRRWNLLWSGFKIHSDGSFWEEGRERELHSCLWNEFLRKRKNILCSTTNAPVSHWSWWKNDNFQLHSLVSWISHQSSLFLWHQMPKMLNNSGTRTKASSERSNWPACTWIIFSWINAIMLVTVVGGSFPVKTTVRTTRKTREKMQQTLLGKTFLINTDRVHWHIHRCLTNTTVYGLNRMNILYSAVSSAMLVVVAIFRFLDGAIAATFPVLSLA